MLSQDFVNFTVSEATLRDCDLISAYHDLYTSLCEENLLENFLDFDAWDELLIECAHTEPYCDVSFYECLQALDPIAESAGQWIWEIVSCLVNETFWDFFNDIAPEGCYFGSIEGDGACIGFWECTEE